jgi:hypothetical protein
LHTPFALTQSSVYFGPTSTVSSYDLSEFHGDPRGVARVADWSDFSQMTSLEYEAMMSILELSDNDEVYISWDASTYAGGNQYWHPASTTTSATSTTTAATSTTTAATSISAGATSSAGNKAFFLAVNPTHSGSWIDTQVIGSKTLALGSANDIDLKVLVIFDPVTTTPSPTTPPPTTTTTTTMDPCLAEELYQMSLGGDSGEVGQSLDDWQYETVTTTTTPSP